MITVSVDIPARVCVLGSCNPSSTTAYLCEAGQTVENPPPGTLGCCNDASVAFVINCRGDDESFDGWIEVTPGDIADVCLDYTVEYDIIPYP